MAVLSLFSGHESFTSEDWLSIAEDFERSADEREENGSPHWAREDRRYAGQARILAAQKAY